MIAIMTFGCSEVSDWLDQVLKLRTMLCIGTCLTLPITATPFAHQPQLRNTLLIQLELSGHWDLRGIGETAAKSCRMR